MVNQLSVIIITNKCVQTVYLYQNNYKLYKFICLSLSLKSVMRTNYLSLPIHVLSTRNIAYRTNVFQSIRRFLILPHIDDHYAEADKDQGKDSCQGECPSPFSEQQRREQYSKHGIDKGKHRDPAHRVVLEKHTPDGISRRGNKSHVEQK